MKPTGCVTKHCWILVFGLTPQGEQKDKVVTLLNEKYKNELTLFAEPDVQVMEWVNQFWNEMIAKKTIDRTTMVAQHRMVKVNSIKHKEAREIGTEWICANTWNQLQLTELFNSLGWQEEKIQLTMEQVISRAVYPGSALASSKWIKDNSAICEKKLHPFPFSFGEGAWKADRKQRTEPTEDLQQNPKPYRQIKFVVHKPPLKKIEPPVSSQSEDA